MQVTHTRMDQLDTVLNSNLDNLVASKVGADRGVLATLSNDIGFVSLYNVR